jgi:hypothetical protein
MTRGILIAGNESSLYSAVSAEAVKRVEIHAAALIPRRLSLPEGGPSPASGKEGIISLAWNPASPISARTIVLAAENRLEQINDAILICSPPAVYRTAETLSPEEIEIIVNDHIKGWFFLVRELAIYFRGRGMGSLSLVAPEITLGGRDAPADLLGFPASASFRAFSQGILAASANEPFQVMGFSSCETGAEAETASWLFKIIDEGAKRNNGKWHKFSRLTFFR